MADRSLRRSLVFGLSILCGLLLWGAWPTSPLTPLIFIAFLPLLYLAEKLQSRGAFFGAVFLSMLIWNSCTTWWVGNTTVPLSGVLANFANSVLMSIPWLGYYNTRRRLGTTPGYFALIVYWLTFEYIHLNWEFSWPWLSLGNVFAMHPNWVQWYEWTGGSGGALWILATNILVYETLRKRHAYTWKNLFWKEGWKVVAVIALPLLISTIVHLQFKAPQESPVQIVVVQPNIDPYDKFSEGASTLQLSQLITLTKQKANKQTAYIVWPETALFPTGGWEHTLNEQPEIIAIRDMLKEYPQARLITGATTLKRYNSKDDMPYSARQQDDLYFDAFNTALQIDTSQLIQIYHKYKMVPGVELIPYSRYIKFLENWALDMGGISGSYGRTPGVKVMENPALHLKVFTSICYESIYGEFVGEHIQLGASLLFIITNDGWWGNTEGHRQHVQYARLRAIESRRWISRSANTGISCFIDPNGDIQQAQPYWKAGVISGNVTPSHDLTFYVRFGDLIYKGAAIFCILLLIYTFYLRFTRQQHHVERN
ncbi:apolipoprotein N-acyltransferase [Chitinophaga pendula]|uniref:apolipoprotein N-acyltransferase n=1 Tax=Chitinophaga pendula TaxID=2849666 RepID=UPI001CEC66AE|nr:apolipoprotein N-acyltransferase [Chitinophaga pendula]UCJ07658.1 apolipoprotein N-acyltransferase [Chitinophaga pendula]